MLSRDHRTQLWGLSRLSLIGANLIVMRLHHSVWIRGSLQSQHVHIHLNRMALLNGRGGQSVRLPLLC